MSSRIDADRQPFAGPAPPAVAPFVSENASTSVNRYDDAFGRYTGDGVNVAITTATINRLEFEVSALNGSGGRLHVPESGAGVGVTVVRTGREVTVHVRSRWWIDGATEGKPSAGQFDVATADVRLNPSADSLGVHFHEPGGWMKCREVSGEIWLPRDSIAAFLDAWNAARAANER